MHCPHCVRAVEDVLRQSDDITEFSVSIGYAEITVSASWRGQKELTGALAKEGFRVQDFETVKTG